MTPQEAVSSIENKYTFEQTGNNFLCSEEWQTLKTTVLAKNQHIGGSMAIIDIPLRGMTMAEMCRAYPKQVAEAIERHNAEIAPSAPSNEEALKPSPNIGSPKCLCEESVFDINDQPALRVVKECPQHGHLCI